jgi:hypothetical protein
MAHVFDDRLQRDLREANVPAGVQAQLGSQRDRLAGAEIPHDLDPAATSALKGTIDRAFVAGFRWVMLASAALALAAAFAAWRWIGAPPALRAGSVARTRT